MTGGTVHHVVRGKDLLVNEPDQVIIGEEASALQLLRRTWRSPPSALKLCLFG